MPETKDLVILGSGPGGYVAAIKAGQLGLDVAVVERDPKFGGTCLHRGCIPTKALLHTAGLLDEIRHSKAFGVKVAGVELDLDKTRAYKKKVVDKNARGIEFLFKKNNVEGVHGTGRVASTGEVVVELADGGKRSILARNILIATGSVPREVSIAPTDGRRIVNSDHLLELPEMPEKMVVVGSGAVGSEFASIYRSFGSEVTLVEMLPRILPLEDEEISGELLKQFGKRGIECLTGTRLAGVDDSGDRLSVRLETAETEGAAPSEIAADMLLVAIGRAPVTGGLGLEALGVEMDRGYLKVDEWMRTSVENIYAIGDVVPTPWLAHVASAEGILAVEHMSGAAARPLDYDRVPSVTYCEPEVASVGLSEEQAKERGHEVAVGKFPFAASGKAAIEGKTAGFVKVVRETRYDELLGVHVIGPRATDLIAEACVALQLESTTEELFRTIHAHPTLSEALAEAAHAATGHAIHI
ncbi:MAG: dihydrolipoyl dehydrogenase [Acidobacteriota bacterium]|nr:dihydrolipoyl dehydrogenase [Acidobacteriota bacterium]